MASWHFHGHVSLRLQAALPVPGAHRAAFHLGCFAPDLVHTPAEKGRSHFLLRIGSLPAFWHDMRSYDAWRRDAPRREADLWFRLGYGVHLIVDRDWVRRCLYRYLAHDLPLAARFHDPGRRAAYYRAIVAADSYHRHLAGTADYGESLALLGGTVSDDLLPPWLDASRLGEVAALVEGTRDALLVDYRSRALPWRRIERFLHETTRNCTRFLRGAMP